MAPESSSSPASTASPSPGETGLDACVDAAHLNIGGGSAELIGELADLGVREFAAG
jgi:hypothetical protein